MVESLLRAAAFACGQIGMAWLALALQVHWSQAREGDALKPRTARRLRLLGALSVLGSLALCLFADHVSMAVLVWVMMLSASAITVALTLAYRPRFLGFLVGWLACDPR